MEKKWLFLVYAMYLALVCLISGIASVTLLFETLETGLDLIWVRDIPLEYEVPVTVRDLVEDSLFTLLTLPIFIWHMYLFRKEVKNV